MPAEGASKGVVVIDRIVDNRRFEGNPSDHSQPSIGGDIAKLTPEQKQKQVGRHWDDTDASVCDVILGPDQTVEDCVYGLLKEGFARKGYTVVKGAGPADIHAEVSIERFWAFSRFRSRFTKTFSAEVVCDIKMKQGDRVQTLVVEGRGERYGQLATEDYWIGIYLRAFKYFLRHFDASLQQAGY